MTIDTMDDWDDLSTITTFDPGTRPDEELCHQSTKLIGNNGILTYMPPVTTPVSLLVQSLVRQLCVLLEEDKQKAVHLYNTICEKLHQMQLLDESYKKGEFENMRFQYQMAFNHLVKITHDSDLPLMHSSIWPIRSVYSLSRYCREFEEVSFIAKGGFGKVFKAKNRLDEVQYAIKKVVIKAKDLDSISQHLNEVKTLASLSHPNIVPYKSAWLEPLFNQTQVNDLEDVEDSFEINASSESMEETSEYLSKSTKDSEFEVCFESTELNKNVSDSSMSFSKMTSKECKALCKLNNRDSINSYLGSARVNLQWATLYIQMSLCDKTLKTWLEERNSSCNIQIYEFNSPRVKEALDIFTQLVNGVHYIHNRGIIHHDIKPTNVFVGMEHGTLSIQLADFGLACPLQRQHNGVTFGTPLYAAPEQIEGLCHVKNDLYSVGFILLELIESFNTSMEKDKTFQLLRDGFLPVHVTTNYPKIAKIIMSLAVKNIDERIDTPKLLYLLKALRNTSIETITSLQKELEEKDIIIDAKDKEISRLQELLALNNISY